jgi:hypothetical protein
MQRCLTPILLMLIAAAPATKPASSSPTETRTGTLELTLSQRSPLSSIKEQLHRFGWRWEQIHTAKEEADYDLASESFQVRVPDSYTPGESGWGLLVWVSPAHSGNVPRKEWLDILDKHKLIWIGADRSGNDRALWCRIGLAVDAATNLQQQYHIDPGRIYVSGMSGGAKIAGLLGLGYADVFTGGIYCCGANYYRDVEAPPDPAHPLGPGQRRMYPRACYPPPLKFLTLSKTKFHHVLITGDNDMNREPTQAMFEKGFKVDGFKHVSYLQVPDMRHELPPAEWFDKALDALGKQ